MKQTTDVMNKNHGLSPKEVSIMNKSNLHNKRLQSLNKGKTKSLGPVEKITMTYGLMAKKICSVVMKRASGSPVH